MSDQLIKLLTVGLASIATVFGIFRYIVTVQRTTTTFSREITKGLPYIFLILGLIPGFMIPVAPRLLSLIANPLDFMLIFIPLIATAASLALISAASRKMRSSQEKGIHLIASCSLMLFVPIFIGVIAGILLGFPR